MAYDKKELATRLLDGLLSGSMAEAARRCGISPSLPFKWLVQSKLGHPDFQEIAFCDVEAPFHIHYEKTVPALMAMQVQQTAFERARDGCLVDVFFRGERQYERVLKPEYADIPEDELWMIGEDWEKVCYETKPALQLLKPSDQLVLGMLTAWQRKRYGQHSTVDVSIGGVLRLTADQTAKPVEATAIDAVFEDVSDDPDAQGRQLALAPPAQSSDEFETRRQAGEFEPSAVAFVGVDGKRTELRADLEAQVANLKANGPKVRQPSHHVAIGKPDSGDEAEPPALPPQTIADHPRAYTIDKLTPYKKPVTEGSRIVSRDPAGIERTGRGPDPATFGGVQGFKKI